MRFTAFDFLTATNRGTSGRSYERMSEMLRRLTCTRLETNIETDGRRERGFFGLIESARIIERDGDDRMVAVEVKLPDWLLRSIAAKKVLSMSRAYYQLRKPLDRRIYELARKHIGRDPYWRITLGKLYKKSGSIAPIRNFRIAVRSLAKSGDLPDYLMAFDEARDIVTFFANGPKGNRDFGVIRREL